MKSTGVVRKVDELGRIVLPIELRRAYDINIRDAVEIYTTDDMIILKKYQTRCTFCQAADNLVNFNGKAICPSCLERLKSSF